MTIVDSSVWVAWFHEKDSQHEAAETRMEIIKDRGIMLTEYVIAEVCAVLVQRAGKGIADQFLLSVLDNESVEIVLSNPDFFQRVISEFRAHQDQKLSLVDISLLVLSESRGASVLTFDRALEKAIAALHS